MCNAQIGRFSGVLTLPVDKTAMEGLATFRVAPNGYRNDSALGEKSNEMCFDICFYNRI